MSDNDTLRAMPPSEITGDIDVGAGDDKITLASGVIINGDIYMGTGDDELHVYLGSKVRGTIYFEKGKDKLYLKSNGNAEDTSTLHFKSLEDFEIIAEDGVNYILIEHDDHWDIIFTTVTTIVLQYPWAFSWHISHKVSSASSGYSHAILPLT
jgi:hypothetical protein